MQFPYTHKDSIFTEKQIQFLRNRGYTDTEILEAGLEYQASLQPGQHIRAQVDNFLTSDLGQILQKAGLEFDNVSQAHPWFPALLAGGVAGAGAKAVGLNPWAVGGLAALGLGGLYYARGYGSRNNGQAFHERIGDLMRGKQTLTQELEKPETPYGVRAWFADPKNQKKYELIDSETGLLKDSLDFNVLENGRALIHDKTTNRSKYLPNTKGQLFPSLKTRLSEFRATPDTNAGNFRLSDLAALWQGDVSPNPKPLDNLDAKPLHDKKASMSGLFSAQQTDVLRNIQRAIQADFSLPPTLKSIIEGLLSSMHQRQQEELWNNIKPFLGAGVGVLIAKYLFNWGIGRTILAGFIGSFFGAKTQKPISHLNFSGETDMFGRSTIY